MTKKNEKKTKPATKKYRITNSETKTVVATRLPDGVTVVPPNTVMFKKVHGPKGSQYILEGFTGGTGKLNYGNTIVAPSFTPVKAYRLLDGFFKNGHYYAPVRVPVDIKTTKFNSNYDPNFEYNLGKEAVATGTGFSVGIYGYRTAKEC